MGQSKQQYSNLRNFYFNNKLKLFTDKGTKIISKIISNNLKH